MNISLLAIDIAKSIFQLHGNDENGKCVLKQKITRGKLLEKIVNLNKCTIVMEACGSSNYWYRKFTDMGHTVKLIAPQYVKPFVKTNKNDANDAEAIAEAASRPSMRFSQPNSIYQQDIQSLHKIRKRIVNARTTLVNQIRGLLGEYGIVFKQGFAALKNEIPDVLEDATTDLTPISSALVKDLYDEFLSLEKKVKHYDSQVKLLARQDESCLKILKLEGIGELSATAVVAAMGDPNNFKNGRHFAAYLGLVPRQNSSGGKSTLLGMSKRGDTYVRTLLIHGARAVISQCKEKFDKKSIWLKHKIVEKGANKAAIALANKNARVLWALLSKEKEYQLNYKNPA